MHRTNSDSLRSCLCFQVFRLSFASDYFNLLLVRFQQAEIIIVKHLIHGRNNEVWGGVEPSTCDHGRRKNDALNHLATLPIEPSHKSICSFQVAYRVIDKTHRDV